MSETREIYSTSPLQTLEECEMVIQANMYAVMQSFELIQKLEEFEQGRIAAGMALKAIKDGEKYKPKYRSFSSYLEVRWQTIHGKLSRVHAYRLMDAAAIWQNVAESCNIMLQLSGEPIPIPTQPSQLYPLQNVPKEEQGTVYAMAVEEAGGKAPTGAQVADVVHRLNFVDTDPNPLPMPPEPEQEPPVSAPDNTPKERQFRRCEDVFFDGKRLTFQLIVPTRNGLQKWFGSLRRNQIEAEGFRFVGKDCEEDAEEPDSLFTANPAEEYAKKQMAKAEENRRREENLTAFFGKEETQQDAEPASFLPPDFNYEATAEGFSDAGL